MTNLTRITGIMPMTERPRACVCAVAMRLPPIEAVGKFPSGESR
jgi:hypothetical protein